MSRERWDCCHIEPLREFYVNTRQLGDPASCCHIEPSRLSVSHTHTTTTMLFLVVAPIFSRPAWNPHALEAADFERRTKCERHMDAAANEWAKYHACTAALCAFCVRRDDATQFECTSNPRTRHGWFQHKDPRCPIEEWWSSSVPAENVQIFNSIPGGLPITVRERGTNRPAQWVDYAVQGAQGDTIAGVKQRYVQAMIHASEAGDNVALANRASLQAGVRLFTADAELADADALANVVEPNQILCSLSHLLFDYNHVQVNLPDGAGVGLFWPNGPGDSPPDENGFHNKGEANRNGWFDGIGSRPPQLVALRDCAWLNWPRANWRARYCALRALNPGLPDANDQMPRHAACGRLRRR